MTNYLYNGIKRPALPERDKTAYPYAYITFLDDELGEYCKLTVSSEPVPEVSSTGDFGGFSSNVSVIKYGAYDYETEWRETPLNNTAGNIIWANHDLYTTDGTLHLAASDPIPILAPVIEPLSMWLGWKAGNWVARQRGKA